MVDVSARSFSCQRQHLTAGQLGPRFMIVGGQDLFVTLASTNVSYNPGTEVFSADVTVENLLGNTTGIGQPLGTVDEIEATGVRVFFHTGPNVTSGEGTVTVANEDGTGTYTASNQPYHEYDEFVPALQTSSAKTWEWDVPGTVTTFVFEVYVEADVPHSNGFVQTDPVYAWLPVPQTVQLSATVRDEVNRQASGSITWSSSDPTIATVNSSGLVTAQSGGVVEIIASSSGPEDDGITRVTVPRDGYQIDLRYLTTLTETQEQAFEDAKARWESHLTGDVSPGAIFNSQGYPVCDGPPFYEAVDDLLIYVIVEYIDGPSGILGVAGPCYVRSGSLLPFLGKMRFDSADLATMEANGTLDDVILHEMAHVLGLGSLWGLKSLRTGTGTSDPRFTGTNARAAYATLGGTGTSGVPVEGTGGAGTRDGHWREDSCSGCETTDYFGNELMTGWISSGTNPLSVVTIDQFTDLGYPGVDNSGADSYTLNPSTQALLAEGPRFQLVEDIWLGPYYVVHDDGTVTILLPDRR
jgi:hypothetical protein